MADDVDPIGESRPHVARITERIQTAPLGTDTGVTTLSKSSRAMSHNGGAGGAGDDETVQIGLTASTARLPVDPDEEGSNQWHAL